MSFLTKEISLPKRRPSEPRPATPPERPGDSGRRGRLRLRSRGGGAVTGLEIGATQLIAARAHLEDGRIVADRMAVRALPPGLVRNGLVTDAAGLTTELRRLFAEHQLPRQVRVGLATPRTVLRVIDLPPLDEADVRSALPLQAQERIPMPLDSAVLDHQLIGLVDTPEGKRLRAIVVAAERAGIETLLSTLRSAGLRAQGIDLSIFAAIRAVEGSAPDPGPILFAQLGDLVNIGIVEAGVCKFTRQTPQGLAVVLGRLAEQREISIEDAQTLLAAAADPFADASGSSMSDVGVLLSRIAYELGTELRAAAEFYGTQSGTVVGRGIVTGPLTPVTGFVDALADASGLTLGCGDVLASAPDALAGLPPSVAAVAVGLAVERVAS